jgi:integrase
MTFFNVVLEASANDGSWEEYDSLELGRLGEPEACDLAEFHAEILSAHWGHVQWRRWGHRTWKIWEPGDSGVGAWVRVVPIDEEEDQCGS